MYVNIMHVCKYHVCKYEESLCQHTHTITHCDVRKGWSLKYAASQYPQQLASTRNDQPQPQQLPNKEGGQKSYHSRIRFSVSLKLSSHSFGCFGQLRWCLPLFSSLANPVAKELDKIGSCEGSRTVGLVCYTRALACVASNAKEQHKELCTILRKASLPPVILSTMLFLLSFCPSCLSISPVIFYSSSCHSVPPVIFYSSCHFLPPVPPVILSTMLLTCPY